VGQQAASSFGVAAVEVDGISEGLEGVKGEAQGEDPIPVGRAVGGDPAVAEEPSHVARGNQQRQVDQDADAHQRPAVRRAMERMRPRPMR